MRVPCGPRLACELCLQSPARCSERQDSVLVAVPLFPGYFFVAGPQGEQAPGPELDAISCTPGCGVVVRPATNSEDRTVPRAADQAVTPRLSPPATLAPPVIAWLRCRVAAIDAGGLPLPAPGRSASGAIAAKGVGAPDCHRRRRRCCGRAALCPACASQRCSA